LNPPHFFAARASNSPFEMRTPAITEGILSGLVNAILTRVRRGFNRGGSALDRHPHRASPLGPGTVVVLDLPEAQQIFERKPGERLTLADPAVSHHVLLRLHSLPLIPAPPRLNLL